jgi:hypothetical protein
MFPTLLGVTGKDRLEADSRTTNGLYLRALDEK